MGLLSGLEKFGFKNVGDINIYEEQSTKNHEEYTEANDESTKIVYQEKDFLLDKTYECPVCYKKFKEKIVRSGKLRLIGTEKDLKPIYEQMNPLKYDIILCPYCGYATLAKFFGGLTQGQVKLIKEKVSSIFQPSVLERDSYSYEEALYRYKLCLISAVAKHSKASEKAYICLKAGWMLRDMGKELDINDPEYESKLQDIREQEKEFLKNALEGFISARQSESYPICGMDEITLEYLIAVLAMEFDQDDIASKLISNIIVSRSANNRIKDKARDIKEELLSKRKEKSQG